MPNDCISYIKSGYFTKLINDYLVEKPELNLLYNRYPKIENFKNQIEEKTLNYPQSTRQVLVDSLENQYKGFFTSENTRQNIALLSDSKTFTITTGHQLNLFTGPLYFLYKIVSTINLCKQLKQHYPEYNFVPIYWMATEDHDFDEINYFTVKNVKIKWHTESNGPVGRLSTNGLEEVLKLFESELGVGYHAKYLKELFENSYLKHDTLADATRFLVNELFGSHGLVILDGDAISLKKLFAPYIKNELIHKSSFTKVNETNAYLKGYTLQVNPREINLFFIEDTIRERIIFEDNLYKVNNTKYAFSEKEIVALVEKSPEKFSPNVLLRPLYEEVILPNLCYIGGGNGEIAYWLQLKSNFDANHITFPMLLIRNSVLLVTEKQFQRADKLSLSWSDLFSNQQELFTTKTKGFSKFNIDFSEQKAHLKKQFEQLTAIAKQTDKSFIGAVKAQEAKQIKGLENLEKRLLKAEKRVHSEKLERLFLLQNELFPSQGLQERRNNFAEYYEAYGKEFIDKLLEQLNPLNPSFTIIKL